ncbi:MAG: O-antigen ligase family protein [Pseudomonadota bacterium]
MSAFWSTHDYLVGEAFKLVAEGVLILSFIVSFSLLSIPRQNLIQMVGVLVVICAALYAGPIAYQFSLRDDVFLWWVRMEGGERFQSPAVASLSYGFALAIALALLTQKGQAWLKLILLMAAIVLLYAILLTKSRSALVGLTAVVFVLIYTRTPLGNRTKFLLCGLFVTSMVSFYLAMYFYHYDLLQGFYLRGLGYRGAIWSSLVCQTITDSMIFGAGMLTPFTVSLDDKLFLHGHSIYLSTFHYGGLVGIVALSILLHGLWRDWKSIPRDNGGRVTLAVCATYSLLVLFADGDKLIDKIDMVWILFWLPVGLIAATASKPAIRSG